MQSINVNTKAQGFATLGQKLRRHPSEDELSTSASSGSDLDHVSSGEEEHRACAGRSLPNRQPGSATSTLICLLTLQFGNLGCARRAQPEVQPQLEQDAVLDIQLPLEKSPKPQQKKKKQQKKKQQTVAPPPGLECVSRCGLPSGVVPWRKAVVRPPPGLEVGPEHEGVEEATHVPQKERCSLSILPGLAPPPGLATPQGRAPVSAPPGLQQTGSQKVRDGPFDVRVFRQELTQTMRDLSWDRNAVSAVRRVRAQQVPESMQAQEYADMVTRVMESANGSVRRAGVAFVAGLAASRGPQEPSSAFSPTECIAGINIFFEDVYPDLRDEVPRLESIVSTELIPTLRGVLPAVQLDACLPADVMRAAAALV